MAIVPDGDLFFCGICGYTQGNTTNDNPHNATIRCSRCSMVAHVSCLRIANNNERLPPPNGSSCPAEGGWVFTCACCKAKIEECGLSRNASVFNNKVDPHYPCLFCDPEVVNSCTKRKQLHMKRVQCGLWAHTVCHLLGNEVGAAGDNTEETGTALDRQLGRNEGEEVLASAPFALWQVDMIVRFRFGLHAGSYAIIDKKPYLSKNSEQPVVDVRMRESSRSHKKSDANDVFPVDPRDLVLPSARRGDRVQVLSGPQQGLRGTVQEVNDKNVVLCDRPSEAFDMSNVAWLFTRPGHSCSSVECNSSGSADRDNYNSSGDASVGITHTSAAAKSRMKQGDACPCLLCHKAGAALVQCGEPDCAECFHVTCALADRRFTVQVQVEAGSDPALATAGAAYHSGDESDDNDNVAAEHKAQLWLHCPLHRKQFEALACLTTSNEFTNIKVDALRQQERSQEEEEEEGEDMEIEDIEGDDNVFDGQAGGQNEEGSCGQGRPKDHNLSAHDSTGETRRCGSYGVNPRYESTDMESAGPTTVLSTDEQVDEGQEQDHEERVDNRAGTTFAEGMDAGECTVLVEWFPPAHHSMAGVGLRDRGLEEADLRELFAPCGHIFRVEVAAPTDSSSGSASIFFCESNAARKAVKKFSIYSHEPNSRSRGSALRDKCFTLKASHLGAQVYVGGLKPGVTEVKLKKVFRENRGVDIDGHKSIAFVKYLKVSSAEEAVREWNQRSVQGVSCAKGVLTVSLQAGKRRARSQGSGRSNTAASSGSSLSFVIDRMGQRENNRDPLFLASEDRDHSRGYHRDRGRSRDHHNPSSRNSDRSRNKDHYWERDRSRERDHICRGEEGGYQRRGGDRGNEDRCTQSSSSPESRLSQERDATALTSNSACKHRADRAPVSFSMNKSRSRASRWAAAAAAAVPSHSSSSRFKPATATTMATQSSPPPLVTVVAAASTDLVTSLSSSLHSTEKSLQPTVQSPSTVTTTDMPPPSDFKSVKSRDPRKRK